LPEDITDVQSTLKMLGDTAYGQLPMRFCRGLGETNKRIFNDAKVSDHFAIIPTTEPPKG